MPTRVQVGARRVKCWQFPPLKEFRITFSAKVGQDIDWGDGWDKEDWQEEGF